MSTTIINDFPSLVPKIKKLLTGKLSRDRLLQATQLSSLEWSRLLEILFLQDREFGLRAEEHELEDFQRLLKQCERWLEQFDASSDAAVAGAEQRISKYSYLVNTWIDGGVEAVKEALEMFAPEPVPVRRRAIRGAS